MKREKEIKQFVKDRYASTASYDDSCCSCCNCNAGIAEPAKSIRYSEAEIRNIPDGAVMGLGCGNPTALAELKVDETVLDLGSGGGVDVFLAAQKVGETGNVIGVDMTSEMLVKARENTKVGNW